MKTLYAYIFLTLILFLKVSATELEKMPPDEIHNLMTNLTKVEKWEEFKTGFFYFSGNPAYQDWVEKTKGADEFLRWNLAISLIHAPTLLKEDEGDIKNAKKWNMLMKKYIKQEKGFSTEVSVALKDDEFDKFLKTQNSLRMQMSIMMQYRILRDDGLEWNQSTLDYRKPK